MWGVLFIEGASYMKNKMLKYIKTYDRRKVMDKANGQEIIEFLNNKWHGARCPLCGEGKWNVTDKVFELREFNGGNFVLGGPNSAITPIIPITCENCGNTVLINALVTGLLKE